MWRFKMFFRWIKWLWNGKPVVHYEGYHCGCCGKWINEPFDQPEYDLSGHHGNGWIGLCPKGTGCWSPNFDFRK